MENGKEEKNGSEIQGRGVKFVLRKMDQLKTKIENYKKKGILIFDKDIAKFSGNYQERARHNLIIAKSLEKFNKEPKVLVMLGLPANFETYDWVIVASYYAMYMSALSALAKINVKCENHTAVPLALAYYFVHTKDLEQKYVDKIKNAKIAEGITKLEKAKKDRITAQYNVTEKIRKERAKGVVKDAEEFVNRIEILLSSIGKANNLIGKTNKSKK